jgi:hypothetical protein
MRNRVCAPPISQRSLLRPAFRLDVKPVLLGADRHAEEAQKSLLPEEIERKWPRVAERDRCFVMRPGYHECGARVTRRGCEPADDDSFLWRVGEIDSCGICQPGRESIRRCAGVDETELWCVFEVLDLNGHHGSRQSPRRSGQLEELEPHRGAAPSASRAVSGTRNIPNGARRSCFASQARTSSGVFAATSTSVAPARATHFPAWGASAAAWRP